MIITKLIGGLGNQMFQYAAGCSVAHSKNTQLKLDISGYKNQDGITPRSYVLNIFNIQAQIASDKEIRLYMNRKKYKLRSILSLVSQLTDTLTPHHYIVEKHSYFSPYLLTIPDNSYLDGFWASEKYFIDIADTIRKNFTLKNNPDKINKDVIRQINSCDSISIHVRRSDYVQDKKTHDFHGVCRLGYYKKAIQLITRKVSEPHFFIFSDDPDWCKANLRLHYPTVYVSHNLGKKDYEDMRLMSACRHNIIANSTFSWWGAWLNKNPDKIIIAPKKWFRESSINTKDLIPDSWIKI